MKVYVVTYGEYSDYDISKIFKKEEDAIKYANANKQSYMEHRVEEHELLEDLNDLVNQNKEEKLVLTYDSEHNNISFETKKMKEKEKFEYHSYNNMKQKFYYSLQFDLDLNNTQKYEKILAEKVAQIKYKIMLDYNGDLRAYYIDNWYKK